MAGSLGPSRTGYSLGMTIKALVAERRAWLGAVGDPAGRRARLGLLAWLRRSSALLAAREIFVRNSVQIGFGE